MTTTKKDELIRKIDTDARGFVVSVRDSEGGIVSERVFSVKEVIHSGGMKFLTLQADALLTSTKAERMSLIR